MNTHTIAHSAVFNHTKVHLGCGFRNVPTYHLYAYVGTLVCYDKHNIPMCQCIIYTHFHIIAGVSNDALDPSISISLDGTLVR